MIKKDLLFTEFYKLNKHYNLSYLINKTNFFKLKYNKFFYEAYQDAFNVETNISQLFYLTPKKHKSKNINIIIAADIETTYLSEFDMEENELTEIYKMLFTPNYSKEDIEEFKISNSKSLKNQEQELQINNPFLFSIYNLYKKTDENMKSEEYNNRQKIKQLYTNMNKEIKIKLNQNTLEQPFDNGFSSSDIKQEQGNLFENKFKNPLFPVVASFYTKTEEQDLSQTFSIPENIFNKNITNLIKIFK